MKTSFEPGETYHIYNKAITNELLFRSGDNYRFFLTKYLKYISPVSRLYAFCLMPNHFHFALTIKSKDELVKVLSNKEQSELVEADIDFSGKINLRFSNLFNSYAKAYNKMFNRSGQLFLRSLKKKTVCSTTYLKNLIKYIHFNPVYHGFIEDPYDWTFSSIVEYQKAEQKILEKELIKNLFKNEMDYLMKPKFEDIKDIALDLDY